MYKARTQQKEKSKYGLLSAFEMLVQYLLPENSDLNYI